MVIGPHFIYIDFIFAFIQYSPSLSRAPLTTSHSNTGKKNKITQKKLFLVFTAYDLGFSFFSL